MSVSRADVFDVCVVGGGPAGSMVSHQLAKLGYHVCVIEQSAFPRDHIGESLPPSILPLLDAIGVRDRIESAGFLRPGAPIVKWAGEFVERQPGLDQLGFQVDRGRFDHILLDAAHERGVHLIQPARVVRSVRHTVAGDELWRISIATGTDESSRCDMGVAKVTGISRTALASGWHSELLEPDASAFRLMPRIFATPRDISCHFLVDATGNGAVRIQSETSSPDETQGAGRLNGRQRIGRPTLAMYAYWSNVKVADAATRVEAGENEWYWGAPLPDGRFNATVFVSPPRMKGRQDRSIERLYVDLINRSELLRHCSAGACGKVRVCWSSIVRARVFAADRFLRVGGAAFTMDPLSSQGVQTAIAMGLQASAVIHTQLARPQNAADAIEFYTERQTQLVGRHFQQASDLYASQAKYCPNEFWLQRAGHSHPPSHVDAKANRSSIERPDFVQLSDCVSFTMLPVLHGEFVDRRRAVLHRNLNEPLVFLGQIFAADALAQIANGRHACQRVINQWSAVMGEYAAWRFLDWCLTRGLILPHQ